jgi:hypothetical protein
MSSPLPRFHDFSLSAEATEQLRRELKALRIYDLTKRFEEYRRACEVTDDMPHDGPHAKARDRVAGDAGTAHAR